MQMLRAPAAQQGMLLLDPSILQTRPIRRTAVLRKTHNQSHAESISQLVTHGDVWSVMQNGSDRESNPRPPGWEALSDEFKFTEEKQQGPANGWTYIYWNIEIYNVR
jgi:hypothetical protein